MANVQQQFILFHDTIKLDYDSNSTLREKRDIVLKKLKDSISDDAPSYEPFHQGSYALFTGVVPLDGEFDIDVGLMFDMDKNDVEPVEAKEWVYEALKNHTDDVSVKTPCVTVTYKEDGQPSYHVDLTVYAANNSDTKTYLAKGKLNSSSDNKFWDESYPKELVEKINTHFDDKDDRSQFRRTIRYLKRWKDENFSSTGNSKPTGISFTIAAINYMTPKYTIIDAFANKREYDDLQCLITFVDETIKAFRQIFHENEWAERLEVIEPFTGKDLLEKMTNNQMKSFKEKLESLLSALVAAEDQVDPVEACKTLQEQFGPDFPVPSPSDTGEKKQKVVATVSSSA